MNDQAKLFEEPATNTITIDYEGNRYYISYDSSRRLTQPKWYAQRSSDLRVSERFYTYPEGAFSALTWGRINWID